MRETASREAEVYSAAVGNSAIKTPGLGSGAYSMSASFRS